MDELHHISSGPDGRTIDATIDTEGPQMDVLQEMVDSMKDAHRAYITTQSHVRLRLPDLHVRDVRLDDIAHSCGMQVRYMGHCKRFYSVAEHMLMVCHMAELDHGRGSTVARCALVHDAVEAYAGDWPSPMKHMVPGYKEFETKIEQVILDALRLPPKDDPVWKTVKLYDVAALFHEAAHMFTPPPPWVREIPERYHHPIHYLGPDEAPMVYKLALCEYGLL